MDQNNKTGRLLPTNPDLTPSAIVEPSDENEPNTNTAVMPDFGNSNTK